MVAGSPNYVQPEFFGDSEVHDAEAHWHTQFATYAYCVAVYKRPVASDPINADEPPKKAKASVLMTKCNSVSVFREIIEERIYSKGQEMYEHSIGLFLHFLRELPKLFVAILEASHIRD